MAKHHNSLGRVLFDDYRGGQSNHKRRQKGEDHGVIQRQFGDCKEVAANGTKTKHPSGCQQPPPAFPQHGLMSQVLWLDLCDVNDILAMIIGIDHGLTWPKSS